MTETQALALPCTHYLDGDCRSCSLLPVPYARQLADKLAACHALLGDHADMDWLPSVASPVAGFRNKAKMAVAGGMDAPRLGLADASGFSTDLRDCPLYPADMQQALEILADFIARARVAPYDIPRRSGELKFLLLTRAAGSGELMLRFVLRSRESLPRIESQLGWLRARIPALRVISANLHPEHKAVLEGEEEVLFEGPQQLVITVNDVQMLLGPRCFWQTNDSVAAALYRQARAWCTEIDPPSLWDLYCGVGGFALHCADGRREITGVEFAPEAIACAEAGRRLRADAQLRFLAGDAAGFVASRRGAPAMLVLNPPRRGLGAPLCHWVNQSGSDWMIYSSCHAETLAADLARLPQWQPRQARLFDMFPHTRHYEVALLLQRKA